MFEHQAARMPGRLRVGALSTMLGRMGIVPRTEFGNPVLRRKSRPVKPAFLKTPQFKALYRAMIKTMRSAEGVGLAAPQIELPLRIAVMEIHPTTARPHAKKKGPLVIVNPRILSYSKETANDWEGCLSCRGIRGKVPRARRIVVSYLDADGKRKIEEASGLWARIFQHEIDHLNGIVFVDRMPNMHHLMTTHEYRKRVLKEMV